MLRLNRFIQGATQAINHPCFLKDTKVTTKGTKGRCHNIPTTIMCNTITTTTVTITNNTLNIHTGCHRPLLRMPVLPQLNNHRHRELQTQGINKFRHLRRLQKGARRFRLSTQKEATHNKTMRN